MKTLPSPFRYFASLLLMLALFTTACGSKEGTVEGVNMLYGKESKVWKTDKQLDAGGDKVKQTDAQEDERYTFFANGQYSLSSPTQTQSGTYSFDEANKKLTFTPNGGTQAMSLDVVTMTDDKLTLRGASGAEIRLEKE